MQKNPNAVPPVPVISALSLPHDGPLNGFFAFLHKVPPWICPLPAQTSPWVSVPLQCTYVPLGDRDGLGTLLVLRLLPPPMCS